MRARAWPLIAAAVACVGASGAASAQPGQRSAFVTPPSAWTSDVSQASALAEKLNALPHFGGAPSLATTEVYIASGSPAALYVTAVAGKVTNDRDTAARVAVDSFLGAARRAQLASQQVAVLESEEKVDSAGKQVTARLHWRDDEAGTQTRAALIVAADAENMIAVTGECVSGADTRPAETAACEQALATLNPGISESARVELALAPAGTAPPEPPSARVPATMTDGSRTPLPPMIVPSEPPRTTDRRPMYVGLGIVLLAALFWWNRRRRDRFDDEGPNDDQR